ncbi:DUF2637 domain-containing protein [Streptomyces ardesiacus]|uniref:DUF2637 domain-containing protein n=1 Tax=Streptomyces ardesiacus TaxID=285564 RepID=UPI00201E8B77|nr:DUF2637 domain-containing protein [Streptomyces ardesiacus]MCL7364896.1 DUF2637 domain-containing protein [Streptomyces ardesiacus]
MVRSIRIDAVLIQAVIAGALSFAHLHDLAEAAGQTGWKAWAYPVSVDLLLVAVWRRLRTERSKLAWFWFMVALVASLGANIATAGLLDLDHVPAWLRILVAGWPALAFLGGTLLAHTPTDPTPAPDPVARPVPVVERPAAPEPDPEPLPAPVPEPAPALPQAPAPAPAVSVPPALVDHARKVATEHRTRTGSDIDTATLRARLGVPEDLAGAIVAQLA